MKLYRKVVMNGFEMEEMPFKREFELEGCLASNPELLSLDDEDLSEPSIIAMESFIKNGREKGDGRADVIVAYSGGIVGLVELKRGEIDKDAYNQLHGYMKARKGLQKVDGLKEYLETEDVNVDNDKQIVGVLVGTSVSDEVIEMLKTRVEYPKLFAIVMRRCRIERHDIFVFANVYQSEKEKDYTKYVIDGSRRKYGKSRMVHQVIKRYVDAHPDVAYKTLLKIFPKEWRGVKRSENGCFIRMEEAVRQKEESGYTRHFLKDEEIIALSDCKVAVSTQWGLGNIQSFIDGVNANKKIEIKISAAKE